MAKDFTGVNTDRVYSTIQAATSDTLPELPEQITEEEARALLPKRKERKTYTEEESAELMRKFKTSGHKGVKLPRIMVAFEPDAFFYIKVMSRVTAMTQSEIVNIAMHEYMKNHADTFEKVLEFRESL
jgi:hypothetical protein